MKHSAQSLRHFPDADPAPPRAVKMDLAQLIAPYRGRGPFTLRVENLPQAARLSAGQNNGDRTWSLLLHELEGLTYYPPQSAQPDQMLALRLIAKDDTEADTIALIDFPVDFPADLPGEALPKNTSPARPDFVPLVGKQAANKEQAPEIAALKAQLTGRETELAAMRDAVTRVEKHWRQTLDEKMAQAEIIWSKEEALRIAALRSGLEEEFEQKLAQQNQGEAAHGEQMLALEEAHRALLTAKEAAAAAKAEQQRLQTQLEDLRQHSGAELAAAKAKASRILKAAESQWTAQTEKKLGALMAQLEAAQSAAQAKPSAKDNAKEYEAEIGELKTQLAHQRLLAETALAAAPARSQADDAYVRGLEREIKSLRATLADREASLARSQAQDAAMPRPRPAQPSIRWRGARQTDDTESERSNGKLWRDAVLVIVAVILAVLFAPRIGLPADLTSMLQSWMDRNASAPAAVAAPAPKPVPKAPPAISVARAVKLRAAPSVNAAIAANLKAGVNVAVIEKRGNWAHVRIMEPNAPVKDGWVYGSYLSP